MNNLDTLIQDIYRAQTKVPNLDKDLYIYMTQDYYNSCRRESQEIGRSFKIMHELELLQILGYPIFIIKNQIIDDVLIHPNYVIAEVGDEHCKRLKESS